MFPNIAILAVSCETPLNRKIASRSDDVHMLQLT